MNMLNQLNDALAYIEQNLTQQEMETRLQQVGIVA